MVDPWEEMQRIENPGSNEFVENQQHESAHITNESSSDHVKANTDCEEANGEDVVRDGVGSGLENGAAEVVEDEAREAEVENGLTTSKVNEVCKVVEVLKKDSSGSDVDWKTEAVTASPSGKTGGSSSNKTTSLRKREDESGDYESDLKRGRSET
ncbi:hypothetical protein MKW92_050208 [Papaver armeniacum]|nr:hypothetical protein MKW92_050208 [Papaver armeniacum]